MSSFTYHHFTAFLHWGIDVEGVHSYIDQFMVISNIPQTQAALVAAAYLADLFELIGEAQPDVRAIHYDPISYREMHEAYINDAFVKEIGGSTLSYPHFSKLINEVFPRVTPRLYKSCAGTCMIVKAKTINQLFILSFFYRLLQENARYVKHCGPQERNVL